MLCRSQAESSLASPGMQMLGKKLSFSGAVPSPFPGNTSGSADDSDASHPLRVYLRVRPMLAQEEAQGTSVISVENASNARLQAPVGSAAYKAGDEGGSFTFDHVFDETTTQQELFTGVMKPIVREAACRGKNGLLFAYGMTNAGKTFSITGSNRHPGILPRTLSEVFKLVSRARQQVALLVEQLRDHGVEVTEDGRDATEAGTATTEQRSQSDEDQSGYSATTAPTSASPSQYTRADSVDGEGKGDTDHRQYIAELKARLTEARKVASLSVSLSFLEIYNEQVYDLLADPVSHTGGAVAVPSGGTTTGAGPGSQSQSNSASASASSSQQPTRLGLRIKEGTDGRIYVRGLQNVTVTSLNRALTIFKRATANKHTAETHLNSDSSRSHTVCNVNLYQPKDLANYELSNDTCASYGSVRLWSRLSIVDLAGSERQARTQSTGQRLREAGKINASLMQLMKSLEIMRWNEKNPNSHPRLVPFRETKLTRLFSDSLGGAATGTTAMLLNAAPTPRDYDETLHTLKYGAIARDVRVHARVQSRWQAGTLQRYRANGRRATGGIKGAGAAAAGGKPGVNRPPRASTTVAGATATGGGATKQNPKQQKTARNDSTAGPAPSSSFSSAMAESERAEWEARVRELESANAQLAQELEEAEDRACRIESDVREEVCSEMESRLASLQQEYASQQMQQEERAEARLHKLLRLQQRRTTVKKKRAARRRFPVDHEEGGAAWEENVASTPDDEEDDDDDDDGQDEGLSLAMQVAEAEEAHRQIRRSSLIGRNDEREDDDDANEDDGDVDDEDEEDSAEVRELRRQLRECEAEIDRLRARHARQVEELSERIATMEFEHAEQLATTRAEMEQEQGDVYARVEELEQLLRERNEALEEKEEFVRKLSARAHWAGGGGGASHHQHIGGAAPVTPQDSPQSANTPRSRVGKVGTRRRLTQVAAGDLTGAPGSQEQEKMMAGISSSPVPESAGRHHHYHHHTLQRPHEAPSSAQSRWTRGSVSRSVAAPSPAGGQEEEEEEHGRVPPLPASPDGEDEDEGGEYDSSTMSEEEVEQENTGRYRQEGDEEDEEEEEEEDDDATYNEEEEEEEDDDDGEEDVSEVVSATPAGPRRRPPRQAAQRARRNLVEAPSPTPLRPSRRGGRLAGKEAAAPDGGPKRMATLGEQPFADATVEVDSDGDDQDDDDKVEEKEQEKEEEEEEEAGDASPSPTSARKRRSKYAANGRSQGKRVVGHNKRSLRSSTRHNRANEAEAEAPKRAGRRTKRESNTAAAAASDTPIAARVRRSRRGTKA